MSLGTAPTGLINRFGMDIEIVEVTQTGTDSYGDPIYDETTIEAKGRLDRGTGDETVQAGGSQVGVDADLYVGDGLSVTWKTVEAEEPTEINVQGETYKVLVKDDQNNGTIRLACKRE